jgi:lipopolysaccharide transport system permease protein
MIVRVQQAVADIASGFRLAHVWGVLGLHDIKQRYRRSTLGPFWLTISTGIMIGTMGLLYARLLSQDISNYLPYLAVGLVLWMFISTTVNELCLTFIGAENLVKQVKLPLTAHVTRVVWRNLLILAHNAVILVPIAFVYGKATVIGLLSALLAVVVFALTAVWTGLILGTLCARFRDIPPIVANITQIVFFLSPILWRPEVLGNRMWIATINPVFHFIEIVRAPMVTGDVPAISWTVSLLAMLLTGAAAVLTLSKYRARVAYWV